MFGLKFNLASMYLANSCESELSKCVLIHIWEAQISPMGLTSEEGYKKFGFKMSQVLICKELKKKIVLKVV